MWNIIKTDVTETRWQSYNWVCSSEEVHVMSSYMYMVTNPKIP